MSPSLASKKTSKDLTWHTHTQAHIYMRRTYLDMFEEVLTLRRERPEGHAGRGASFSGQASSWFPKATEGRPPLASHRLPSLPLDDGLGKPRCKDSNYHQNGFTNQSHRRGPSQGALVPPCVGASGEKAEDKQWIYMRTLCNSFNCIANSPQERLLLKEKGREKEREIQTDR